MNYFAGVPRAQRHPYHFVHARLGGRCLRVVVVRRDLRVLVPLLDVLHRLRVRVVDAVCFVCTCRRLIDLSLIALYVHAGD